MNSEVVVVPNPREKFSEKEITQTLEYVKQGGILIVLDRADGTKSTANDLLSRFDMEVLPSDAGTHTLFNMNGETVAYSRPGGILQGGEPILETEDGNPVLAVRRVGKGQVIVGIDSELFSASVMGGVNTVPDDRLRRLYEVEFDMLRKAASVDTQTLDPKGDMIRRAAF